MGRISVLEDSGHSLSVHTDFYFYFYFLGEGDGVLICICTGSLNLSPTSWRGKCVSSPHCVHEL